VSRKGDALDMIERGDGDSSGTLLALVKMEYQGCFLGMNYLLPSNLENVTEVRRTS
jgi:hypothetical protein